MNVQHSPIFDQEDDPANHPGLPDVPDAVMLEVYPWAGTQPLLRTRLQQRGIDPAAKLEHVKGLREAALRIDELQVRALLRQGFLQVSDVPVAAASPEPLSVPSQQMRRLSTAIPHAPQLPVEGSGHWSRHGTQSDIGGISGNEMITVRGSDIGRHGGGHGS